MTPPQQRQEAAAAYHALDALLRIHEDLFHVEDVIARQTYMEIRLARLRANGFFFTLIGGVIATISVVIAVSGVEWSSAPTWTALILILLLFFLRAYQAKAAGKLVDELNLSEEQNRPVPLSSRSDYLLEQVHAYGLRFRALEAILATDLDDSPAGVPNDRYETILADVRVRLGKILQNAKELHEKGVLSKEQLEKINLWARPYGVLPASND